MNILNTKELRNQLSEIVKRTKHGEQFTVLYRSKPAFRIVPVMPKADEHETIIKDSLYKMKALGATKDGLSAADHDSVLYG